MSLLQVSRQENVFDTRPKSYPIQTIALEMRKGNATLPNHEAPIRTLKQVTLYAREIQEQKGKAAYEIIKQGMPQFAPAISPSGEMSGLCCLEYDDPDIDTAYAFVLACQNPHVVMVWRSLSLKPKILVRIDETDLSPSTFPHAWISASQMFEELGEADTSASRPHQLQNICYDPDLYINPEAIPLSWSIDNEAFSEILPQHFEPLMSALIRDLGSEYVEALERMEYKEDGVGTERVPCPFGGNHENDGWGYRSNGTRVIKNGENDWTLQCFKCGGKRKRYAETITPQQKLQRVANSQPIQTESLNENERAREDAVTENLQADTERTQIHLISDVTGSGKSHTTFAKAKEMQKRAVGVLPHTDLAQQAVEVAHKVGFFAPFHLKGRDVSWESSGIAEIPVERRDETLFDRNPCIMVDQVKTYTDKRIAGRTYCEHKCEFRGTCVKDYHLSQYKGLEEVDFLATCMPNLLYNPAARGFLHMLLTGGKKTPTDVDDVLSAALDLPPDEEKSFDMAIMDDYTIAGLYNECEATLEEIQETRKAWKGYAAGEFAGKILPAFLETEPKEIFQILSDAVDSLTDEQKELANSQLSQHARHGKIETAPKIFADADKQALSRYIIRFSDEGVLYIPKDALAYTALRKINVPVVELNKLPEDWKEGDDIVIPTSIVRALMSNIPLGGLSPVWQPQWTLLDQIETLKKSVGTPENAPVWIVEGTLMFSVPPQDSGLLSHIHMLSPHDETEPMRTAFKGQDVEILSHVGRPIEFQEDVKVYQYADHRLTAASVMEYPKDDGKRQLQAKPTGITAKSLERFEKLNDWAGSITGVTCFISYKEIAEMFDVHLDNFDVVTHFDRMAGLNLEGLTYLVVYGYPKVKHEVVISQALTQFAGDTEPIPTGTYDELTETLRYEENGLIIYEARYKDSRLESIRHQLATDKLQQAIGRARHVRWKGTTTVIFTNAPVPTITERSELFSDMSFKIATHPRDLADAMERINAAQESGDARVYQETTGVSEATAYRRTREGRERRNLAKSQADAKLRERALKILEDQPGISVNGIAELLGVSWHKANKVLGN